MLTYAPTFEVVAMLCDSAAVADGKLYVQGGGWDTLTVNTVPFHHSRFGLAINIRVPWTKTNKVHMLKIQLQDEDGKVIRFGGDPDDPSAPTAIGAQFNLGRPPHVQAGTPQILPFALNIDRQRFNAPGNYAFVMFIDDEEEGRLPFRVMLTSAVFGQAS